MTFTPYNHERSKQEHFDRFDRACSLEDFAENFEAARDELHQTSLGDEDNETVWKWDEPFTFGEVRQEFLRSSYHRERGFPLNAVEAAWCVFRLCVRSDDRAGPDWLFITDWAKQNPLTRHMIAAVLCDVHENLSMSQETFERRMGPFDAPVSEKCEWRTEGF